MFYAFNPRETKNMSFITAFKQHAKMVSLLILLAVSSGVLAQASPTSHEEKPSKDYVVLIRQWAQASDFAKNTADITVNKIIREMKKDPKLEKYESPDLSADLKQFFYEQFSSDEMMQQLATMYQEYFSIEEMMALINFYNTPLGQKVVKSNAALAIKSQQVGGEILKKHEKDYMKIIAKYIKDKQK